jgi:hypothetical protein
MEEWKDIEGYEELYKINRKGDVYSYKTKKLKTQFNMKNVEVKNSRVGLNKNGKTKTFKIDDLLYKTFGIDYTNNKSFEGEIWVDVNGFKGMYKISNFGRVKSLDRYIPQADYMRFIKGKILSIKRNNGSGYVNVSLQCGNDIPPKNYYLHILVAEHFIDNPNNYSEVNHIDFNKSNNHVSNLEWCDRLDNIKHLVDNRKQHFITKELKLEVLNLMNDNINSEDISKILELDYSVVKQIENILKRGNKAKLNREYMSNLKKKADLSKNELEEIRDMLINNISKKEISNKYGCSYWVVDSINRKIK